ncbi:MAG: nodulation protein NfeD [bacterium]
MRTSKLVSLAFLVFLLFLTTSPLRAKVIVVPVDGSIDHGMAGFVQRTFRDNPGAEKFIIKMNTYGGRVDAAMQIVEAISETIDDGTPVEAYVKKKAWSAGALISLACSRIWMGEEGSIGAATPVSGGGGPVSEKYVSALRAEFRSLAQANGYPPTLSEAMVDRKIKVLKVRSGNKIEYVDERRFQEISGDDTGVRKLGVYLSDTHLLTLTAEEANQTGFTSKLYSDFDAFLSDKNITQRDLERAERSWSEELVTVLQMSSVSTVLMILAFLGIQVEAKTPGLGVPGAIGISSLLLLLWGKYMAGLAAHQEILLVLVGLGLVCIEVFLVPGLGWAGIPGALLVLVGIYLMFLPFVVPADPWDYDLLNATLRSISLSLILSLVGLYFLWKHLPDSPVLSWAVQSTSLSSEDGYSVQSKREKDLVGREGRALTDLQPMGKIRIDRDRYPVRVKGDFAEKGDTVEVVDVESNEIIVKKVNES